MPNQPSSNAPDHKRGQRISNGKLTWRHAVGCLGAIVLIPSLGIMLIFYVAGLGEKEWAGARPTRISHNEWAEKRALCESAGLSAASCAGTRTAEVRRLQGVRRERRRQELCAEDARPTAVQKAQEAVLEQLRAPSTANFVGSTVRTSQKGCDWSVTGNVDAQNAFGGTVRSFYRVELRRVPEDTWLALRVTVQ